MEEDGVGEDGEVFEEDEHKNRPNDEGIQMQVVTVNRNMDDTQEKMTGLSADNSSHLNYHSYQASAFQKPQSEPKPWNSWMVSNNSNPQLVDPLRHPVEARGPEYHVVQWYTLSD
jgi:hypothetical protein